MKVNIAKEPHDLQKGLMNQTNFLPLVFVFPKTGRYSMHMKHMKSHIDIFWISARGKVVRVYKNVAPSHEYLYPSGSPVKYAIESKPNVIHLDIGDVLDMHSIMRNNEIPTTFAEK